MVYDLFAEQDYQKITRVPLSPYSNDLNPIENLFGTIKIEIQPKLLKIKNLQNLEKEIKATFDNLVVKGTVRTLLRSMPERIQAVREAEGGPIRFEFFYLAAKQ